MRMKILFVCKHNRFKGKVAEAYFKKINRDKKIKVMSAGVFKGIPVAKTVINIGKKLGIRINKKTRGLKEGYLSEFDLVLIVADNIPDTSQNDKKNIKRIMKEIFKKTEELNENLRRRK